MSRVIIQTQGPSMRVDQLGAKYPYHLWFDGRLHLLIPAEDFRCGHPQLRAHLHKMARDCGHRVRTKTTLEGMYVQAIDEYGVPLPYRGPSTPAG